MSKISGTIEVYSKKMDFVTSKSYDSKIMRNQIIEKLKKQYPNRIFFLVIKPNIHEYKD